MISTEYPPMVGGVGRYTHNLTNSLQSLGHQVIVLSDKGHSDFHGISPTNKNNSKVILDIVNETKPDVIHVQFEPGLYGMYNSITNSFKIKTHIDKFYSECDVPIITTFHSLYSFREWLGQVFQIKKTGKTGIWGVPARLLVKFFKDLMFYKSLMEMNREKLKRSHAGIGFSNHVSHLLDGKLKVIYHGAETLTPQISLNQARESFSLPLDKRIGITIGFRTVTKGWDVLDKLKLPDNWLIVSNSSKNHYSRESVEDNSTYNEKVIDLKRGYLSEQDLSLLLCAGDVILLPYKITSGSGVMFDALAHNLPFIASDLKFFKEFADLGLGITFKRNPNSMAKAIKLMEKNYEKYYLNVKNFNKILKWSNVAEQHIKLYKEATINHGIIKSFPAHSQSIKR